MDRQPFNVLPYMKYPNMIEAATNGVKLASMIGKLPREAQENAAQASMASIAAEQSKAIQARIKVIQGDKTLSPTEKTTQIQQLLIQSGFGYDQGGGKYDPLTGLLRGQQYQATEQEIKLRQMQNPSLQPSVNPAIPNPRPAPVQQQPTPVQQPAPVQQATPPADKDLTNQLGMMEYQHQIGAMYPGLMPAPISQASNYAYA